MSWLEVAPRHLMAHPPTRTSGQSDLTSLQTCGFSPTGEHGTSWVPGEQGDSYPRRQWREREPCLGTQTDPAHHCENRSAPGIVEDDGGRDSGSTTPTS